MAGLWVAGMLPAGISDAVVFAGRMFVFLGLWGLLLPIESAITGWAADRIIKEDKEPWRES